jgi:hypothetical protein
VHQAAEEILWQLSPGELPNARQREILKLAGIQDRDDLDREVGRVSNVRQLLREAGSKCEHTAAAKAAAAAVREEREKLPRLEQQLAAIQSQIDELQQASQAASGRLGKFNRARDQLRDPRSLPAHIRNAFESDRHAAAQTNRAPISSIENQLSVISGLERIDLMTQQGQREALLHCESAQPQLIRRVESLPIERHKQDGTVLDSRAGSKVTLDVAGFQTYRQRRLAERIKLQRDLEKLTEERIAAIASVEKLLDHYVDRIA